MMHDYIYIWQECSLSIFKVNECYLHLEFSDVHFGDYYSHFFNLVFSLVFCESYDDFDRSWTIMYLKDSSNAHGVINDTKSSSNVQVYLLQIKFLF